MPFASRKGLGQPSLRQPSLFRRLMFSFSGVLLAFALAGLLWAFYEAKATQRTRTNSENMAHVLNMLAHLKDIADRPQRMAPVLEAIEANRQRMFGELDYHSRVRVRVWRHGQLVYNSMPALPDRLPETASAGAYAWVRAVARDDASGIVVERQHEVDDEWMLSVWGVGFLLSTSISSLPLLLIPAWLIVGIGLRPLRSFASAIAQRSDADLTPLPDSKYRELSPLVDAINGLMGRLSARIEREHEFLADAAHELKTPLAAIQINAHVLLSRCKPGAADAPERYAEPAAGLREGVARATHTVHQLLALERAHLGARGDQAVEPTDVAAFVRDRVAALAHLAVQRNIEIEFHAGSSATLPLHRESMAAALDNLIGNAIKYSPQDGCITVRLVPGGRGQRLTVTDRGPGIDPALRRKVFDRFYRVPGQEQPGSGLGLAIAERGAARNGGAIVLGDGEDGRGLSATIDFAGA